MLVDLGDVVVHIMHPTVREFYNLEEIWGGKTGADEGRDQSPRQGPEEKGEGESESTCQGSASSR